jgi:large subunit ribosomal protein L7/L12
MNVTELRCTSCLAPVDLSRGPAQRCIYCGATLTIGAAPGAVSTLRLEECGPNKIMVIKVIRTYTGLGLVEAKDLTESTPCILMESDDKHRVERFRDELVAQKARASINGVTAAFRSAPAAAPTRGGGAFIEDAGANKIWVIKVIREATGLGLKESKDIVDSVPCAVGADLDAAASERLREALREAGARVR